VSVLVREMLPDDVEDVVAIERACFPSPWSSGVFRDELVAPERVWLVAVGERGGIVGYGGAFVMASDVHILNLAIEEDSRRTGVGREIVVRLLRRAAILGAERVTLEVRPSNVAARRLYESFGLHAVGVRPDYYRDTDEHAVIMWGELEPAQSRVLAIETSCDETAAAVVSGGREVVSSVVASQVDFHARFGGVVPEIASRKHTEAIAGVVDEALDRADLGLHEIDALAVTYGPGLVGALVVGLAFAKGLSAGSGVPLIGVNHLEGHVFANVLSDEDVRPPLVALIVSGGHTSLVHMPTWGEYHTLGETLDDATGEAFDKVAKVLGLGYPGGPILSRLAEQGDPHAIAFPRAMMHSGDLDFSLSGLKTAVINHIRHERESGRAISVSDLAASFQEAIVDVQVAKALAAIDQTGARVLALGGGVAANPRLRAALVAAMDERGVAVSVPPPALCTDNATMIGAAGHYRFLRGDRLYADADAQPALRLDSA
jgi:N6-L-threonylcarbamoyladenine synthase/protein kinase Bud32